MYIKNNWLALIYKFSGILVCLWGLWYTSGLATGRFNSGMMYYYTNQSNILCLVYFVIAFAFSIKSIVKNDNDITSGFAPKFKGAVVMAITVTMLIYWFMLHETGFSMDADAAALASIGLTPISNLLVHLIVPFVTIFDWLLFAKKGLFKGFYPVIWLIIPLAYYIFTLITASTGHTFLSGSRYPYFFIDSDLIGWNGVAMYIPILAAVFLLIGYAILGIDRLLVKIKR